MIGEFTLDLKLSIKKIAFYLLLFLFCTLGCTENPFQDNESIKGGLRTISGEVELNNDSDPSGILVCVENFEFYTFTDSTGNFTLTFPEKSNDTPGGGISGKIDIYYYVSNYQVVTHAISIFDGALRLGDGDVDENGKLPKVILIETLQISTTLDTVINENDRIEIISFSTTFVNLTENRIIGKAIIRIPLLGYIKIAFVWLLSTIGVV